MAVPDVQEILRMLDDGREAEAIGKLEAALPRESLNVTLRILLARAYERVGRLGDAMESWTTALFLAPGSSVARAGVRRFRNTYPDLVRIPSAPDHPLEQPAAPYPESAPVATPAPFEPDPVPGRVVAASDDSSSANLDRLIERLQGARIVPDPDFEIDESLVSEDDDDRDNLVSETLARIYAAQEQYREAAQVYEVLAEQQPERAEEFRMKAREMKMRGHS
jgi:tetratricopeptide (TPR) repeat protein